MQPYYFSRSSLIASSEASTIFLHGCQIYVASLIQLASYLGMQISKRKGVTSIRFEKETH